MAIQPYSVGEEFFTACYQGDLPRARDSIRRGAEVNYTCRNGWQAIHGACQSGQFEAVKFLIEKGCNVEMPNALGQTPLHLACAAGHVQIAGWLVNVCKIDAKARTTGGATAADVARRSGHRDIVNLLGEDLEV